MTEELCSYGMSRSGVELTDEVTELMAVEAEAGLDVTKLRRCLEGRGWVRRLRRAVRDYLEVGLSSASYWPSSGRLRP